MRKNDVFICLATMTVTVLVLLTPGISLAITSSTGAPRVSPDTIIEIPPPTFSIAPGVYEWTQDVAIADTAPGAAIFYTLDGTAPSAASTPYTVPIQVGWEATINAIAVAGGVNSAVVTGTYTIERPLPPPTFSPNGGGFPLPQTIRLTDDPTYCSHAVCNIYYRIEGVTKQGLKRYSGPFTISAYSLITNPKRIATAWSSAEGVEIILRPALLSFVRRPSPQIPAQRT